MSLMIIPVWNLKEKYQDHIVAAEHTKTADAPELPKFFDCLIAEYLLCEGKYFFNQETTMKRYKVTTLEELMEKQKERLEKLPETYKLFQNIEMPLVKVLWQMEQNGIHVDRERLEKLGKLLEEEIKNVVADIDKVTLLPINLSSPLQVGKLLAENFQVPLAKTSTGKFATSEQELMKHAEKFPVIQNILKFRQLSKLKSTYVEGLLTKIDELGKIHTTYNQAAVLTGRLSSSNPNMQNIPANSEIGIQIKSCFIPSPGYTLVSFDYSQQELRILAHITKEPKLLEAFSTDRDVHTVTAATLFNVPYEQVTKAQRAAAKTINFGVLYGMGPYGLSQALSITPEAADKFINDFFTNFSQVKKFYATYMADAVKNKYAETMFGRRRFVTVLDGATRRELANYPFQGAAADLMKKAMVDVDKQILPKWLQARLLLQIHDDLVFEFPEKEDLTPFITDVKKVMENTFQFDVPMKVEVKTGKDWGTMAST